MNRLRDRITKLLNRYSHLVLPLACAGLLIASGPLWKHPELKGYDFRVGLCRNLPFAQNRPSGKVVMVGIEELAMLKKKPFIFWYPDLGRFIRLMAQSGVVVVGLDLIPYHPLEQKLPESFKGMEGSSLSLPGAQDIGRQLDGSLLSALMQASRDTRIVQGVSGSLVPFYFDLMAFMENVEPASLRVEADADGILRRQIRNPEGDPEAFVARLYRATNSPGSIPDRFNINYMLLDRIPLYSFEDIVGGAFDLKKLRDKVVILGIVSAHEDVHATPVGIRAGALVHAAALESLITKSCPTIPGRLICVPLVVLLCFGAYPLTRFRSPFRSLFWLGLFSAVCFILDICAFSRGYAVPMFPALVAPVTMFGISYLYRYMVEERGRRQLYQTFSYYVDRSIIDQLITQDSEKLMKGEERDVCVMFLDIRGFTALSERIPADAIVAMLNTFFGRVTEIVQRASRVCEQVHRRRHAGVFRGRRELRGQCPAGFNGNLSCDRRSERVGGTAPLYRGHRYRGRDRSPRRAGNSRQHRLPAET